MFPFFYELLLWILAFTSIPKILKGYFKYGKYKESLPKRFGMDFPNINKGSRKCVWIHAVSVGETKAVAPLAQTIKQNDPDCILILSTITETAHAEAKKSLPFADHHVFLPFDFRWIVSKVLKKALPDLVILCETDFWYNFLAVSKKLGAKTILVNGKLSERSQTRFKKFSFLTNRIFPLIDLFCIQSNTYAERFKSLGIPSSKIVVTGNIKLDYPMKTMEPAEFAAWKQNLGLNDNDPLLVVGSTHDPEEKQILNALQAVWQKYPTLKVMLVPRHPERFQDVAGILDTASLPYIRYSQLTNNPASAKVILMDAMGLLRQAYQCCTLAIVAGSYTDKVGGHNILEPSWYGKAVVYGPQIWSQPELDELMRDYKAGLKVPMEELSTTLLSLLDQPALRNNLGQAGLKMIEESRGATKRTWEKIAEETIAGKSRV